ncbi:MAG: hypothetical protein NZM28_07235 [Fimbriimonadales bacterium]|nr:hypothetical protein [Fimbriimonadales bacterium]
MQPTAVSEDGTVVVGYGVVPAPLNAERAFRWSLSTGMQVLSTPVGLGSRAYDVSADGRVVVGQVGYYAVRWENGELYELGGLGTPFGSAHGVSADGTVIVGYANVAFVYSPYAFRWTPETGMQRLDPSYPHLTAALAVSSDGNAAAGWVEIYGNPDPFRWTRAAGTEALFAPWAFRGAAFAISDDGNVVVGWAANSQYRRAFRWTPETGVQSIHTTDGIGSEAYGVSGNGQIVVGIYWYPFGFPQYPFVWTQATGMRDLNQVYTALLRDGSVLYSATAISSEGRYIVGAGSNGASQRVEVFLLDTWRTGDTNGDGCIDDSDLLRVLFAFGSAGTGYARHEDINKDGVVDDADLLTVLLRFGNGC